MLTIDDSKAPHMVHSVVFTDLEAWLANYDSDFSLIIESLGES